MLRISPGGALLVPRRRISPVGRAIEAVFDSDRRWPTRGYVGGVLLSEVGERLE
jgi:hypothetical protein